MDKDNDKIKDNKNVEVIVKGLNELAKPEGKKVCPVCGHENKLTAGYCKMCSNYLF